MADEFPNRSSFTRPTWGVLCFVWLVQTTGRQNFRIACRSQEEMKVPSDWWGERMLKISLGLLLFLLSFRVRVWSEVYWMYRLIHLSRRCSVGLGRCERWVFFAVSHSGSSADFFGEPGTCGKHKGVGALEGAGPTRHPRKLHEQTGRWQRKWSGSLLRSKFLIVSGKSDTLFQNAKLLMQPSDLQTFKDVYCSKSYIWNQGNKPLGFNSNDILWQSLGSFPRLSTRVYPDGQPPWGPTGGALWCKPMTSWIGSRCRPWVCQHILAFFHP